jgi:two-component system, sensor histidine kinase and response regulator
MNRFSFITSSRNLKAATFEKVRNLLLQQIDLDRPQSSIVITEEDLDPSESTDQGRFILTISKSFSALLLGIAPAGDQDSYQVQLTFDRQSISMFLSQLSIDFHRINAAQNLLQPNNLVTQSEFTLLLLEVLEANDPSLLPTLETPYPAVSVCKPVEDALSVHVAKERLLNQMTAQTNQRLQLAEILENAIEQVRNFLQIDRVAIYQLKAVLEDPRENRDPFDQTLISCITYESCINDSIPSLLHQQSGEKFGNIDGYKDLYSRIYSGNR